MRAPRLAGLAIAGLVAIAGPMAAGGFPVAHGAPKQTPAASAAAPDRSAPSGREAGKSAGQKSGPEWGDGRARTDPRDRPAEGEPYKWRQMGMGALIMGAMLAFVIWLVRRQRGAA